MATTKKRRSKASHTGFRNSDFFCYHCGRSKPNIVGIPLDVWIAGVEAFTRDHEHCPPGWTEPENVWAGKQTEIENLVWWLQNGNRGQSSYVMAARLSAGHELLVPYRHATHHPADPNDLWRCVRLIRAVPQIQSRLDQMIPVSPVWKAIIGQWDVLTELLEKETAGKPSGLYQTMKHLGC